MSAETRASTAAAPPAPLLEVENLRAGYGQVTALFDVSLSVRPGQAVALLGINGAGKTTLAAVLTGLLSPQQGSVRFDGRDVTGSRAHRIARLGLAHVPEGRGIFPSLTVEENIEMALRHILPRSERRAARDRIAEIFPILGQRSGQRAGLLSGGEQQQLALARVVAAPPKLLVADELSFGLAPQVIDVIFDALAVAKAAGTAILLIEQYVDRALEFADEAVLMDKGRVSWFGPSNEAHEVISAAYLTRARAATADGPPPVSGLAAG